MKKLLPYLQLFRIPNVFTAMADIIAGFVFVSASLSPSLTFACLLVASSLMYMAGMVLNDVFDVEQDTKERPQRPIPSGSISRSQAAALGWGMLAVGVVLAWLAGFLTGGEQGAASPWRPGVVATILAACIVAYDAVMKRTPVGPIFMGACRFFNILLGMSAAGYVASGGPVWLLRYEYGQLLIAGGVGVYISGVTWFARTEAKESNRGQLAGGLAVMVAGLVMIGLYPQLPDLPIKHFNGLNPLMWQLLILLLSFTIFRSAAMAVYDPRPKRVQMSVKTAITSLIVIDAAICMIVGPYFAIGVLALLLPTLLLGQWVYST